MATALLHWRDPGDNSYEEVTSYHPLPVQNTPGQGVLADYSGTITTGGTAQTLAGVNLNRRYLLIENPSTAAAQGIATAESLWINFTTTAVVGQPSIELVSGGSLVMDGSFVSTESISVVATTTAHAFIAKAG